MTTDDEDFEEDFEDELEDEDEIFEDDVLQLKPTDAHLLYDCIIHAIKTNSGHGFHNSDQGHAIYAGGAIGSVDEQTFGEVPDDNELFSLLNRLAGIINDNSETGVKVYTWREFCKMAVDAARPQ